VTIQKGGGGLQIEIRKPMCVFDYRNHTGSVDGSDHHCATCFHMEISELVEETFPGAWKSAS
jgi:hypothetical protein